MERDQFLPSRNRKLPWLEAREGCTRCLRDSPSPALTQRLWCCMSFFAALRVALAYEFQVVPAIPVGPADEAVHSIVTEARLLDCTSKNRV